MAGLSKPGEATEPGHPLAMTEPFGESSRVHDDIPPPGDQDAPVDNLVTLPAPDQPSHLVTERAYLGSILANPALGAKVLNEVTSEDFDEPRHQAIHQAMTAVLADGLEPDTLAVQQHLRHHTKTFARTFGNGVYLFDLMHEAPLVAAAQVEFYAGLIREAASHRRIASELRFAAMALDQARPETWHQALGYVMDRVDAALNFTPTTSHQLHADLTWLLNGTPPLVEPPTYVHRAAGGALFYPGRVNGIYGDPESAKTWIAQVGIVEALTAGQSAGFIDVDHNGAQLTTERLLLLGATIEQLANPDLFRYHEPTDGPELLATVNAWGDWKPAYVVLDSVGEMMPMLGVKSVDNDELSGALRALTGPLVKVGSCVVTVDHLPKSHEARTSGYAIGGTAKKRAIDGTLIHAEAKISPAPNAIGRIILRIEKDRPGRLRAICSGKYIGTFTLDSTNAGAITTSIDAESVPTNAAGLQRPTNRMEAISRYVEEHEACTYRDIKRDIRGGDKTLQAAIARLIEEGYLSTFDGANNSTRHHSIEPYREADDDQI